MEGTSTRANIMSGKGTRPGAEAQVEARAEVAAGVEAEAGTGTKPNAHERIGTGKGGKRDITAVTTGTGTNTDGILIMKNTGETRETSTYDLDA